MSSIVLFDDKKDCCGCGACMNVCPKNAIRMAEDEVGFVYPEIDQNLCIGCGACKKACGYQMQPMMQKSEAVYAAASNDDNLLRKSASGGAFAVLAENVLKKGGVVYGAALPLENGKLEPKHLRIDTVERLTELQGSKYVQSAIGDTYAQAKKDLLDGKSVLFSGTPCQIAGLKQYLKKDYENLLTVDIICHGVPSKRFFQSFMEDYGKKLGGTITEFYFRDKSKGQGMITRSVYKNKNGEQQEKIIVGNLLSYFNFFLRSFTYRKNCYSCPFASEKRVGDLTLGDFWGFHEEYPSYDEKQGLSNGKGVSCICQVVRSREDVHLCVKTIVNASGVVAIISIINVLIGSNLFYNLNTVSRNVLMVSTVRMGIIRAEATFGHPVYYAMYCALIIPLALYVWQNEKNAWNSCVLGLNVIAAFLTESRGTIVVLLALFLVYVIIADLQRRY